MRVLIFDPSGNFEEGKGISGWALNVDRQLKEFGMIDSSLSSSQETYWHRHSLLIEDLRPDIVVCESYRLQTSKAMAQAGSSLETPQLIGHIRMTCYFRNIPFIFQDPSDKVRVADPQMVTLGVFTKKGNRHYCMGRPTNDHERDAIRHGYFYHHYGKGKQNG